MSIFKLPDLGEGLPDAEIVKWHVAEGDLIEVDMPLVSMETAKAVVEVPSPVSGTIKTLFGKSGEVIETGSPLAEFISTNDTGAVAGKIEQTDIVLEEKVVYVNNSYVGSHNSNVKATPAVRALAKSLDVDLSSIIATGTNNTITRKDVELAAAILKKAGDLEKITGSRRAMIDVMCKSYLEVVPVTIYDDAILNNYNEDYDITVKLIQAIGIACSKEPYLNSWYDHNAVARRVIKTVDLGIAIDSKDGLFVPVLKDSSNKTGKQLRIELDLLKDQVLDRTLKSDNFRGASITLSNFGKFAGKYGTPIIVPPQVAILGVGRLHAIPVIIDQEVVIRNILPLSLTFDHRACTGGEAARFLKVVMDNLG